MVAFGPSLIAGPLPFSLFPFPTVGSGQTTLTMALVVCALFSIEKQLKKSRTPRPREFLLLWCPYPKFLRESKLPKLPKKPENTIFRVFSGACSLFLFSKFLFLSLGVGFFRGVSGSGVLDPCSWSSLSQVEHLCILKIESSIGAKKSTQTFFVQSFSTTLRVMDVRAENRGRPHQ